MDSTTNERKHPTSPLLEHLRTMLATYDKALGELFAARGVCHEQFVDEQFRLRSEAQRERAAEHYGALVEEAAAERDQAQGYAEDFGGDAA